MLDNDNISRLTDIVQTPSHILPMNIPSPASVQVVSGTPLSVATPPSSLDQERSHHPNDAWQGPAPHLPTPSSFSQPGAPDSPPPSFLSSFPLSILGEEPPTISENPVGPPQSMFKLMDSFISVLERMKSLKQRDQNPGPGECLDSFLDINISFTTLFGPLAGVGSNSTSISYYLTQRLSN